MSQWDICPEVQHAVGDGQQQIIVMVESKAPKNVDSDFVMKVQAFHSSL